MKIFLIDDDAEEAELLSEAIWHVDPAIEFRSFDTGMEALKTMQEGAHPDLIFLDLNMPQLSGKEVLEKLRTDPVRYKMHVVIYSTSISRKDIEDTQAFNVKSYLQKPDDFKLLQQAVQTILTS